MKELIELLKKSIKLQEEMLEEMKKMSDYAKSTHKIAREMRQIAMDKLSKL